MTDLDELIAASSLGAAMRDIAERGIDAHSEDLLRELDDLPEEFGGNAK